MRTRQPAPAWKEEGSGAENGVSLHRPPIRPAQVPQTSLDKEAPPGPDSGAFTWGLSAKRPLQPALPPTATDGDDGAVVTVLRPPPFPEKTARVLPIPSPQPGDQPAFSRVPGPLRVADPLATCPTSTAPRASGTRQAHTDSRACLDTRGGCPDFGILGSCRKVRNEFLDGCLKYAHGEPENGLTSCSQLEEDKHQISCPRAGLGAWLHLLEAGRPCQVTSLRCASGYSYVKWGNK